MHFLLKFHLSFQVFFHLSYYITLTIRCFSNYECWPCFFALVAYIYLCYRCLFVKMFQDSSLNVILCLIYCLRTSFIENELDHYALIFWVNVDWKFCWIIQLIAYCSKFPHGQYPLPSMRILTFPLTMLFAAIDYDNLNS